MKQSMIIQLTPKQVPQVWDAIKFASLTVDKVLEKDAPSYFRKLLVLLLSGKAQCFVRLDEQRQLLAVAITRVFQDEISGNKSLFINCLYSFKGVDAEQWRIDFDQIKKFAKSIACKKIIMYTSNNRVFEIASSLNFVERFRSFSMEV